MTSDCGDDMVCMQQEGHLVCGCDVMHVPKEDGSCGQSCGQTCGQSCGQTCGQTSQSLLSNLFLSQWGLQLKRDSFLTLAC